MPATYNVPAPVASPSRAGVLRIQSPLALAKNGTLRAPSQRVSQRSSPVAASKALAASKEMPTDSVVYTREPPPGAGPTTGPE